jgi:hypothetical protein
MRKLFVAIIVLGLCRVAIAGTVQDRLMRDPAFQLYVAIFKVTQMSNGSIDVQTTPCADVRWMQVHPNADPRPVNVKLPKKYVSVAVAKVHARYASPAQRRGQPKEFYTYFYYSPQLGARVIEDVHERE